MTDDDDDFSGDDDDDESVVVTCPNCKGEVYEDAEQCPKCGEWLTRSTHPLSGRPWWFVALGLIGLVVTALVLAAF